jgi:hypothetical protein
MMTYNYTIKPLILSQVMADTSIMTYLTYIGQKRMRPYVMWYIEGGERMILVDTAIEAASYREYHAGFRDFPFEHVQRFRNALQRVNCTPEDIQTKVSPFASAPVIIPGIYTDPYQAYKSILKIKSSADIIIPLHDYEMARKNRI